MTMDPSSAAAIASHSGELFEESGADDIVRREPRAAPQGSSSQRRALDVADDMVLEYIAFRGFTETFRSFSLARADDRANRGSFDARFAVDALLRPARDLDALGLLDAWDFLEARFFGNLDAELAAHVGGLRCGVYRLFCVTAVRDGQRHSATALLAELARRDAEDARGRPPARAAAPGDDGGDRALWFLDDGDDGAGAAADARGAPDARNGSRWREWFAMPHLPEPHKDPLFAVYFTQKWRDAFVGSLRNFLATVFAQAPPPKLLLLQKWHRSSAVAALRSELREARAAKDDLAAAARASAAARDGLAAVVRDFVAHAHHEHLRDANKLARGGLFDEDPDDARATTRERGADVLEFAKKCARDAGGDARDRDAQCAALCDKAAAYLNLIKGTGHVAPPTEV